MLLGWPSVQVSLNKVVKCTMCILIARPRSGGDRKKFGEMSMLSHCIYMLLMTELCRDLAKRVPQLTCTALGHYECLGPRHWEGILCGLWFPVLNCFSEADCASPWERSSAEGRRRIVGNNASRITQTSAPRVWT